MKKLANEELNRKTVEEFKDAPKTPIVVVLDNIRSLNNIGSVFRTADAFLIEAIFLCGVSGTPPHKDIQRTALGSTESVNWQYFGTTAEAVTALKNDGYKVCAIEQAEGAVMLNEFELTPKRKTALVFGNEVKGVEQQVIDQCDTVIEIPQIGTKHSLNISVSVGVVLWDLFVKLNKLDN